MDLGWVGMTQVWSVEVRTSRWTSNRTTGGHQEVLQGVKSFQRDSGRLSMSHEWSGVVSDEVKQEYMTHQGRLQDYSLPHCSKVKSHLKFI